MIQTIQSDFQTLTQLGDFHRQNLETLRDALIANELPFDMVTFADFGNDAKDDLITNYSGRIISLDGFEKLREAQGKQGCGTSACAVGWAPLFIPPEADAYFHDETLNKTAIDYMKYSDKYLLPTGNEWWFWCFAGSWDGVDNSRLGAAFRIDALLNASNDRLKNGPQYDVYELDGDEILRVAYQRDREIWLLKQGLA